MSMVLASYEPGGATVIRMKVDPEVFGRWIAEPREAAGARMRSAGER